jgi:hypothetical protein
MNIFLEPKWRGNLVHEKGIFHASEKTSNHPNVYAEMPNSVFLGYFKDLWPSDPRQNIYPPLRHWQKSCRPLHAEIQKWIKKRGSWHSSKSFYCAMTVYVFRFGKRAHQYQIVLSFLSMKSCEEQPESQKGCSRLRSLRGFHFHPKRANFDAWQYKVGRG